MFHSPMESRGKQETDTDFVDACFDLLRRHVQIDTEGFEDIGAAAG
jgi:hypothetical protein